MGYGFITVTAETSMIKFAAGNFLWFLCFIKIISQFKEMLGLQARGYLRLAAKVS